MKDYVIPLEKRLLILVVLGLPFVFKTWTAVAVTLPLAVWFLWGEWRVFRVNEEGFCYRRGGFGSWVEVAWPEVVQATWTGPDRVTFRLADGTKPQVVFGGLTHGDCLEVAGWINRYSPCGLRRLPQGDPGWSDEEGSELSS